MTEPAKVVATRSIARPILVLGMSHVVAIRDALNDDEKGRFNLVHIRQDGYLDMLTGSLLTAPEFREQARSSFAPDIVFAAPHGNFHNIFGLVESPQPFDFALYGEPLSGRELVPSALIRDHFRDGLAGLFEHHLSFKRVFPNARLIHVTSPPPLRGGDMLLNRPGAFPGILERGPTPPEVRMRFYRLQIQLIDEFCRHEAIEILQPPKDCIDDDGFLLPNFATDPTHGNAKYGRAVIDTMLEVANG